MGTIRLLLAISVVIAHSTPVFGIGLVGGRVAVQSFYLISGFYMTLILNEKYIGKNNSYKLFITNRLLRLYPVYWTVLLLTIFAAMTIFLMSDDHSFGKLQPYFDHLSSLNFKSTILLIISNLMIVFQDLIMFLGIDLSTGNLFFTADFRQTEPKLYSFLLIPQAWTISIEITFYLIAPFILRKNIIFICGLAIISALLRIMLYSKGLNHDPWTYRFFPTELLFFLLGAIAYHCYTKIHEVVFSRKYLKFIYIFLLTFTFSYSWLPINNKAYIYILIFFISLPFIFLLTKDWKNDRYAGDLSYPIYLSHILIIFILDKMQLPIEGKLGLLTIILSILLSIIINKTIGKRIEVIRQSRIMSKVRTQ